MFRTFDFRSLALSEHCNAGVSAISLIVRAALRPASAFQQTTLPVTAPGRSQASALRLKRVAGGSRRVLEAVVCSPALTARSVDRKRGNHPAARPSRFAPLQLLDWHERREQPGLDAQPWRRIRLFVQHHFVLAVVAQPFQPLAVRPQPYPVGALQPVDVDDAQQLAGERRAVDAGFGMSASPLWQAGSRAVVCLPRPAPALPRPCRHAQSHPGSR